jgi:hypothetical protein
LGFLKDKLGRSRFMLADAKGVDTERSEVSRLLIVNEACEAYSGKEVLLIAVLIYCICHRAAEYFGEAHPISELSINPQGFRSSLLSTIHCSKPRNRSE